MDLVSGLRVTRMRYYTGVGSRRAPASAEALIRQVALVMNERGYCLRSGAAEGPDTWFAKHAAHAQIFLPWPGFGDVEAREGFEFFDEADGAAYDIAAAVHPAWDRLSQGAKKLHARNAHQVLGPLLHDPSDVLVCWTPGAKVVGGTATAMKIAGAHRVPIFNLASDQCDLFRRTKVIDDLLTWLDGPADP